MLETCARKGLPQISRRHGRESRPSARGGTLQWPIWPTLRRVKGAGATIITGTSPEAGFGVPSEHLLQVGEDSLRRQQARRPARKLARSRIQP